ncbi:S8 family peptidase [Actinophytocola gossypii]|uniref:S8 family peptidase n=1 Tax=Actinophytocola gossypii TaxID=2812003 RepID=A0ABT2J278_9PSEU|nr:S8 family peptidase [Actinophytocola gossypii]MCT2581913.1 S8 family peptidase [Actinophytocola gossypii]
MHPRWAKKLVRPALTVAAAAAVGLGFAAPASAAEGKVLGTDAPGVIENSYIVVLEDTAEPAAVAAKHDARVTHTFEAALHGYAATMSEADAKRTAADPAVAYVEQNRVVAALETQPNPPSWGLDRVDQRSLPLDNSYTYPNTASNVTAYIIDTGIRTSHQDFGGRASWGTNTVDSNDTDCNGHGTHVAGTVGGSAHGIAKEVDLVAVKVLNCQGSGTLAGVTAGVDWVTQNAQLPAVANMSLGAQGSNASLENAVRNSINAGVTYALASGNSSANACNFTPARTPEAITVNATTSTDARASFSNYGTCTDIFAPGQGITSAWNTSDSSTNTISGTSMAAPHVAGAAAVHLGANPSATPAQVQAALKDGATKGDVTNPGSGSPNNLLFVGAGTDPDPGDPDEPGEPEPCEGTTAWSATSLYFFGDQVSYGGHLWMLSTFFSYGEAPGSGNAWFDLGAC